MQEDDILDKSFFEVLGLLFVFQIVFANCGGFLVSLILGFFGLFGLVPILGLLFSLLFVYFAANSAAKLISKRFFLTKKKFKYILALYILLVFIIALFTGVFVFISIAAETAIFGYYVQRRFFTLMPYKFINDTGIAMLK